MLIKKFISFLMKSLHYALMTFNTELITERIKRRLQKFPFEHANQIYYAWPLRFLYMVMSLIKLMSMKLIKVENVCGQKTKESYVFNSNNENDNRNRHVSVCKIEHNTHYTYDGIYNECFFGYRCYFFFWLHFKLYLLLMHFVFN